MCTAQWGLLWELMEEVTSWSGQPWSGQGLVHYVSCLLQQSDKKLCWGGLGITDTQVKACTNYSIMKSRLPKFSKECIFRNTKDLYVGKASFELSPCRKHIPPWVLCNVSAVQAWREGSGSLMGEKQQSLDI